MDGVQNGRHYEAGDTIKLEIVLHHRANLNEVRAIFTHSQDKSAPPLMARGQPRAISERDAHDTIRSRLVAEITLPRTVTPGVYELERISYETAGGQLGHLPDEEGLTHIPRMTFEVMSEPEDTPMVIDIAFDRAPEGPSGGGEQLKSMDKEVVLGEYSRDRDPSGYGRL